MTRKEFVTKATEHLAGKYSPGEAKALSVMLLSLVLGLYESVYSVDPDVVIPRSYLTRLQ